MKIRQGFVSNSSTTSFCIYGCEIDGDIPDYLENIRELYYYHNYNNNISYIGRPLYKMEDNETFGDFKRNVEKILKEAGYKKKLDIIQESWYDG